MAAELLPDGRLGRQAAAIADNLDVPLTLAPSPDTLAAWAALAATGRSTYAPAVDGLRSALHRDQVLAGSYVPIDVPSLISHGLGGAVNTEIQTGAQHARRLLRRPPRPEHRAARSRSTRRSLGRVAQRVAAAARGAGLGARRRRRRALHARAPDDGARRPERRVDGDDGARERRGDRAVPHDRRRRPRCRAAHVLAALAVVAGEQPNRTRGVAIVNPARWDAPPELVTTLFAGLRGNPLVSPVTVDTLFAQVPLATVGDEPDGAHLVRTLAPIFPAEPPVTASQYSAGRDRSATLSRASSPSPTHASSNGDRALLSALSSAWANPAGRHKPPTLLDGIGASVDGFLAKHPRARAVDASRSRRSTAEIPITFDNDTGPAGAGPRSGWRATDCCSPTAPSGSSSSHRRTTPSASASRPADRAPSRWSSTSPPKAGSRS